MISDLARPRYSGGEYTDWSRNMAEKNTRKANRRSGQWIEGGVTTVAVSALLTISWRAYTVGKILFWRAWPGVLGVAVVGIGLIMLVFGAALRDKEEGSGSE